MGRPKIKLRTTEQAANYYAARPVTYGFWTKAKLVVLGWFGLAKKYKVSETDPRTGTCTTIHGYAYKGTIYLTKQVVFTPTSVHFGKPGEAKLEPRP